MVAGSSPNPTQAIHVRGHEVHFLTLAPDGAMKICVHSCVPTCMCVCTHVLAVCVLLFATQISTISTFVSWCISLFYTYLLSIYFLIDTTLAFGVLVVKVIVSDSTPVGYIVLGERNKMENEISNNDKVYQMLRGCCYVHACLNTWLHACLEICVHVCMNKVVCVLLCVS